MCKWWCDALCSELQKKRPLISLSASFDIIIVWTSFRLMIICRDDTMMNVQECWEFPLHTTKSLKLLHESTWTIFLTNFTVWCLPAAACSCLRRPHRNTQNKNRGQERNQSREQQKFHRNGISSVEISKCPVVTFSKISRIYFFRSFLSLLRFLLGVLSVSRAWFSCSHIIFAAAAALFFFSFSLKGRTPKNE